MVSAKSHVDFLCECLSQSIIPKAFLLKNNLPGDKVENERRLNDISKNAMLFEKQKHLTNYETFREDVNKAKDDLKQLFSNETFESEVKRLEHHLSKLRSEMSKVKQKKIRMGGKCALGDSSNVTLVRDDDEHLNAHKNLIMFTMSDAHMYIPMPIA